MNHGLHRGFTWHSLPTGESYPTMKVKWFEYGPGTWEMGSGQIDTLCWINTVPGNVTIELNGANVKDGQCIHFAAYGANKIILQNSDGTLFCAATPSTRAQYSVITAMLLSSYNNEWIVFGDVTV